MKWIKYLFGAIILFTIHSCHENVKKNENLADLKIKQDFKNCDTTQGKKILDYAIGFKPTNFLINKSIGNNIDSLLKNIGISFFNIQSQNEISSLLIFEKQYLYLLQRKELSKGGNLFEIPYESGAYVLWQNFKNNSQFYTPDSFYISIKIPFDYVEKNERLRNNKYLSETHAKIKSLLLP
jgi:hypothetical protein